LIPIAGYKVLVSDLDILLKEELYVAFGQDSVGNTLSNHEVSILCSIPLRIYGHGCRFKS
jgi:hypothetical protein